MCLVVVNWQQHAEYPLIVAGNRDEFHARATQAAHWWPDHQDIVAGRDLQAGGTWLGLHRRGRFATVTNFRDAQQTRAGLRSRGHLVSEFLSGDVSPMDYLSRIDGERYAGFNLLVGDGKVLAYRSNRGSEALALSPGTYGLSNALLDSPWHKVSRSKAALQQLVRDDQVDETRLFRLLGDRQKAPTDEIRDDQLSFAKAHAFSATFIVSPEYGTRSSSVARLDRNGNWRFRERRFEPDGATSGESAFAFAVHDQE